jgi:polar amino acid transport system ATP-binding protein
MNKERNMSQVSAVAARGVVKEVSSGGQPLTILSGLDLEVAAGESVAIVGASGSGKTTLLRCVDLLEEYGGGEIRLDGELMGYRVDAGGRRRRLSGRLLAGQRARIGMVFQSYNLFPHLNALANVMLGLTKVRRIPSAEARKIAETWLDRVGLADRRDHYPSALSGGQQQRVAIARALSMEPRLLLLDEVTSALDPELVQEVLVTIRQLAEAGTTMLIVTHEMRFARNVSTRTVFMDQGRVLEEGPPDEVFGNPKTGRLADFLAHTRG